MTEIERACADFLSERKKSGILRELKVISPVSARLIQVEGKDYVNFSGNDYLGLSHHPQVMERAAHFAHLYGAGAGASRLVTGNITPFAAIEEKLARFKGAEAALIMVSGYQANVSVLPALFDKGVLGKEPLVFADRNIHASMLAGCAAAGIAPKRFAHNDIGHLETLLKKNDSQNRPRFILTESVFSMDGDIAPLGDIRVLADRYGAFLIVDDAHATGILGEGGKGLSVPHAHLTIGTFGKGMGSFGAYIACSKTMKEYLVNRCGGVVYATALPPAVLGSIDAALDLVPGMKAQREQVAHMAARFRAVMAASKRSTGKSESQIIPVITGSAERASAVSAALKDQGLWVAAIRPPTVQAGSARLRVSITAAHTDKDLEKLIACIDTIGMREAA